MLMRAWVAARWSRIVKSFASNQIALPWLAYLYLYFYFIHICICILYLCLYFQQMWSNDNKAQDCVAIVCSKQDGYAWIFRLGYEPEDKRIYCVYIKHCDCKTTSDFIMHKTSQTGFLHSSRPLLSKTNRSLQKHFMYFWNVMALWNSLILVQFTVFFMHCVLECNGYGFSEVVM